MSVADSNSSVYNSKTPVLEAPGPVTEPSSAWGEQSGTRIPVFAHLERRGKRGVPMSQDIHNIQQLVADASGLTVLDLRSARRSQPVARTRQMAMWLCRRLTLHSLPEIGRAFGDRDHTTVMHAIAVTEQRMAADARFSGQVMGIAERIDLEQTNAVRRAMA